MKKFKFKLEPVLNIRECHEKQIQGQLGVAFERLEKVKCEMDKVRTQRRDIALKLEEFKANPYGIEDLLIYQGYLETLDVRLDHLDIEIEAIKQEIEEIKKLLVEASKEKKIVEKIKEKKKNDHSMMMLKNEIDFLDEVSTIRCARKRINLQ